MSIRYVGTVPLPDGRLAPICVSIERHVCNPYCGGSAHAELLYREDDHTVCRPTVQAIADLVFAGRPVLDLRPAYEAPLPPGFAAAWLVTYGPLPAAER